MFDYYRVSFLLIRPMLGTATDVPIYAKHIIVKSQKLIKEANATATKMSKALQKYKGDEFSDEKGVKELQALIRHLQMMTSNPEPSKLPEDVPSILELWETLSKELRDKLEDGPDASGTMFLKDKEGKPIISTHMVLGNLKDNARNLVNNSEKGSFVLETKVSIGEVFNSDVKPVDEFMWPSIDVVRHAKTGDVGYFDEIVQGGRLENNDPSQLGVPRLFERPLRAMTATGPKVAIARSEMIPPGAVFSCILRIRQNSPITEAALHKLFAMGRNNGFGQWRGSGNMGAYKYKLEPLPDYVEETDKLDDGWL
jgi:hypothetical protein